MESNNRIDGLEVFVKVQLGLILNPVELEIYNSYDEVERQVIFDFINDPVFSEHLNKIIKKLTISNEKKEKIFSK